MSANCVKSLMLMNGIKTFSVKQQNSSLKLSTESVEEHTNAINVMNSINIELYTFSIKGESKRYRRYLIHGFDTRHPDEEVVEELDKVSQLQRPARHRKTPPAPTVICLTDTRLTTKDQLRVQGYTAYRDDMNCRESAGGVGILVRRDIVRRPNTLLGPSKAVIRGIRHRRNSIVMVT